MNKLGKLGATAVQLFFFAVSLVAGQTPNTLTDAEKSDGWKLMFDGKNMDGWHNYNKRGIDGGWVVNDNAMHRRDDGAGSILAPEAFKYQDFELTLDWKIADNGNSGIFLRYLEDGRSENERTGPECQVGGRLNNDYFDGMSKLSPGACYDMYPPAKTWIRPAAQYNTFHVVVFGKRIAHYGNQSKLLEYTINSADWTSRYQVSKYKNYKDYGTVHAGKLYLQDHGNPVWFRNIKIRQLTSDPWADSRFVWPDAGPSTLISPLRKGALPALKLTRDGSGALVLTLPEGVERSIRLSDATGARLEISRGFGSWSSGIKAGQARPGAYFLDGRIGGQAFARKVVLP